MKVLIVVDMQEDFTRGALGSDEAVVLMHSAEQSDEIVRNGSDVRIRRLAIEDDFPEGEGKVHILQICCLKEERGDFLRFITGNAASDGGDIEKQLLMLAGK